jgi:hypothetical protein
MDKSEIGRALQSLRKSHEGGRQRVAKACPKCWEIFGARDSESRAPATVGDPVDKDLLQQVAESDQAKYKTKDGDRYPVREEAVKAVAKINSR